jgi:hypothetical protein
MVKSTKIQHVLSDGVVVEQSSRKGNRTGYTGAALSPAWTLNSDKPFIAACGNPTDPAVMTHVNAQARTSLHLGYYSDAREAAYVIGRYRKDPVSIIRHVQSNGSWDQFPEDLYSLPSGLSYEEAIEMLSLKKSNKTSGNLKSTPSKKDTSVMASGNLYDFFSREVIVGIAKAMGGAEMFQSYLKDKTIAQFAQENSLPV